LGALSIGCGNKHWVFASLEVLGVERVGLDSSHLGLFSLPVIVSLLGSDHREDNEHDDGNDDGGDNSRRNDSGLGSRGKQQEGTVGLGIRSLLGRLASTSGGITGDSPAINSSFGIDGAALGEEDTLASSTSGIFAGISDASVFVEASIVGSVTFVSGTVASIVTVDRREDTLVGTRGSIADILGARIIVLTHVNSVATRSSIVNDGAGIIGAKVVVVAIKRNGGAGSSGRVAGWEIARIASGALGNKGAARLGIASVGGAKIAIVASDETLDTSTSSRDLRSSLIKQVAVWQASMGEQGTPVQA